MTISLIQHIQQLMDSKYGEEWGEIFDTAISQHATLQKSSLPKLYTTQTIDTDDNDVLEIIEGNKYNVNEMVRVLFERCDFFQTKFERRNSLNREKTLTCALISPYSDIRIKTNWSGNKLFANYQDMVDVARQHDLKQPSFSEAMHMCQRLRTEEGDTYYLMCEPTQLEPVGDRPVYIPVLRSSYYGKKRIELVEISTDSPLHITPTSGQGQHYSAKFVFVK